MKRFAKIILTILFIIPALIGFAGYLLSGKNVSDSLYLSISLYFFGSTSESCNIWIEIARWTAPLMTATVILSFLEKLRQNIVWWFMCRFSKDSVAVYTDSDLEIVFDKKTKGIYPGNKVKGFVKSHIIIMNSDAESFSFYEKNAKKLSGKPVYIGLREIDLGLIEKKPGVEYFAINNAAARMLWKKVRLWKTDKTDLSVVIYGNGNLTEDILYCGLQMNLYSPVQAVTYHIIGNRSFEIKHPAFKTMNNDKLVSYSSDDMNIWSVIRKADIIIISEEASVSTLQSFAVNCGEAEIYYFSPRSEEPGKSLCFANLIPFGRNSEVLTDENIRREKLIADAKRLNYNYAVKYNGETDWNKLSAFLRASNVSSADFHTVIADLTGSAPDMDRNDLAKLEHIRWCRFHFLNYWTAGDPGNGKRKDADKKIHKCLVPYEELDEHFRQIDIDNVSDLVKNSSGNNTV